MNMTNLFKELYVEKYGTILTKPIAESIVHEMAVTDGSDSPDGEHWTYDDAKMMGDKIGVNWEAVSKCEFYVVLNMMYSDYGKTIKKHGMPDTVFGELANDWFMDVDAEPDKTFKYFLHF